MAPSNTLCCYCEKRVTKYNDFILCVKCEEKVHIECAGLTIIDYREMEKDGTVNTWKCKHCYALTSDTDDCDSARESKKPNTKPCGRLLDEDGEAVRLGKLDLILEHVTSLVSAGVEKCGCETLLKEVVNENYGLKSEIVQLKHVVLKMQEKLLDIERLIGDSDIRGRRIPSGSINKREDSVNFRRSSSKEVALDVPAAKVNSAANGGEMSVKGSALGRPVNLSLSPPTPTPTDKPGDGDGSGGGASCGLSSNPGSDGAVGVDVDDGFTRVVSRKTRKRPHVVVGCKKYDSALMNVGGLAGVEKRLWLYVGRTAKNTVEGALRGYLQQAFPNSEFVVKRLV